MNKENYAVYEKVPAHGSIKNGLILGPFNSKKEAQSAAEKWGYNGDNYYINNTNNERYQEIIDEVWKAYGKSHWTPPEDPNNKLLAPQLWSIKPMQHNKQSFISEIKSNPSLSKMWGLKIEERALSQRERVKLLQESWKNNGIGAGNEEVSTLWVEYNNLMTKYNIPTKLTTVTYNNEKIEVYE